MTQTLEKMKKLTQAETESGSMRNTLVIVYIAGHSIMKDWKQCVILNEKNPVDQFYKTFEIERTLRSFAYAQRNVYVVGLFACCR